MSCHDNATHLVPNCSFCLQDNNDSATTNCNGNCQIDDYSNSCERKGKQWKSEYNRLALYRTKNVLSFGQYIYPLEDFLPVVRGECSEENRFGSYNILTLAEIGCSSDVTCIGILDEGCDKVGPYTLCKDGYFSPSTSCIYQKKAYTGT